MIVVKDDGSILDESGVHLREKMTCECCIFAVEITDDDEDTSYLVCANTGPIEVLQLPPAYRCAAGKWFCRQKNEEGYSVVATLGMEEIVQHRLGNAETLEILDPWF